MAGELLVGLLSLGLNRPLTPLVLFLGRAGKLFDVVEVEEGVAAVFDVLTAIDGEAMIAWAARKDEKPRKRVRRISTPTPRARGSGGRGKVLSVERGSV